MHDLPYKHYFVYFMLLSRDLILNSCSRCIAYTTLSGLEKTDLLIWYGTVPRSRVLNAKGAFSGAMTTMLP